MTRIIVAAGGTGGGVYPALAVVSALRKQVDSVLIHFVSSTSGMENTLLERTEIEFERWDRVQAGPIHGVSLPRKILSVLRLAIGLLQSLWLLLRYRPGAAFVTGGWASLPVALAAWLLRTPVIIFVPDIEPGQTLQVLGRLARVITATVEDTAQYYRANRNVIATGYPLRPALLTATREDGLNHFGLDPQRRTLLVFGGSRGSRAINRAVYQHASGLLEVDDLQILHISGKLDALEVQAARDTMSPEIQAHYHVRDYVDEMGLAFAVADLAICRAGASTLSEFPAFGLPSILIPLAYTWRYQEINADWLASRGAAIRLDEDQMPTQLVPLVHDLLRVPERLGKMREAAQALSHTDGAANIARVILNQARQPSRGTG